MATYDTSGGLSSSRRRRSLDAAEAPTTVGIFAGDATCTVDLVVGCGQPRSPVRRAGVFARSGAGGRGGVRHARVAVAGPAVEPAQLDPQLGGGPDQRLLLLCPRAVEQAEALLAEVVGLEVLALHLPDLPPAPPPRPFQTGAHPHVQEGGGRTTHLEFLLEHEHVEEQRLLLEPIALLGQFHQLAGLEHLGPQFLQLPRDPSRARPPPSLAP